ncbi:transcription factor TFIIE beta subunit, TFIIEB, Tfa2 [Mycoemilia scoparia]|uniref:Transcription initiation factor IIE subunit beta n=1 Tax=Mycoemilia scoparia TaxID=417184 RepID=A0A9W7ZXW0_9FUNG|nr:transcription factor TFIIE beta subunit, TFIIEB, Tfa2 [Mycoemilia scoparia]
MSDLLRQRDWFKKRISAQPVYSRPSVGGPSTPRASNSVASTRTVTPNTSISGYPSQINRYTPASIYSAAALDTEHINNKMFRIVDHLKKAKDQQTLDQIQQISGVMVHGNDALIKQLMNNAKVIYDKETETFAYKPEYNLRTKEDLLKLLKDHSDKGGIKVDTLKDSFLDINSAAKELKDEGKIFTLDKKDGRARVMFYASGPSVEPVDEEIKEIWDKLSVPDEADLKTDLEKANMKPIRVEEEEVVHEEKKKKQRQSNRKIKITNTHLKDLDLTGNFDSTF